MLWYTHLFAGVSAGLLLSGHAETALVSAGISGLTALLPDIDSPDSWIGRRVPLISRSLKASVGHRGPLHSLLGATAVSLALTYLFGHGFKVSLFVPVLAGYLSHLVMDTLNPPGVPWLWPLKRRIRVPLVEPMSLLERLVVAPGMFLACCWLAWPALKALAVSVLQKL